MRAFLKLLGITLAYGAVWVWMGAGGLALMLWTVFGSFVNACGISHSIGLGLIVAAGVLSAVPMVVAIGNHTFRTGREPEMMDYDRYWMFSLPFTGIVFVAVCLLPPWGVCSLLGRNTPNALIAAAAVAVPLWLFSTVLIEGLIQKWRGRTSGHQAAPRAPTFWAALANGFGRGCLAAPSHHGPGRLTGTWLRLTRSTWPSARSRRGRARPWPRSAGRPSS